MLNNAGIANYETFQQTDVDVKPIKCMHDMEQWGQLAMNLSYEVSTM